MTDNFSLVGLQHPFSIAFLKVGRGYTTFSFNNLFWLLTGKSHVKSMVFGVFCHYVETLRPVRLVQRGNNDGVLLLNHNTCL